MPIDVYNLENLFWDNNSYKVPNGIPNLINKKSFNSSPVMIDYFTGFIDLYGDFNYCNYKGTFYILKQDKPIDINKKHWRYVLIKDVWINLLVLGKVKIKGDAVIWNDDVLLSKHLNKCLPALDNPCSLNFLNFKPVDFNWKKHAKIKPIDINISQTVLSAENLRYFKNSVNGDLIKRYRIAKKRWYPNNPQWFLLSRLQGTQLIKGWKQKAIDKINESLKDFQDVNKASKRRIVKVTQAPTGSPLKNLYAISYDSESLGTGEETGQQIEEISFDGLIDIVPIHWNTLKESIPTKELNETTGVFNIQSEDIKNENFLWKISRKAYLPIKTNKNKFNWLRPIGDSYDYAEASPWDIEPPQSITLKTGQHGYLWYVDKLDFILHWFNNNKFFYSWQAVERKEIRDTHEAYPFRFWKDTTIWPAFTYGTLGTHPGGAIGVDYLNLSFFSTLGDKIPPYGWLIFQLLKTPQEWKQFEYLGNDKKIFEWFAGLKNNFLITFQDRKQWWSTIPKELSTIAGDDVFSKMHLHLDNFTWLAFAPCDKSYGYSYHSDNGFNHLSYVNNQRYTIYAMRSDIYGNGITIVNPYSAERINAFLSNRISKLDSFTIRDQIEFPWEIKKGDYLISSLEYDIKDLTDTEEIESWYRAESQYTIYGRKGTKGTIYGALGGQTWTIEEGYLLEIPKAGDATKWIHYPIFKPIINREFLGDFRSLNVSLVNHSDISGQVFICSNRKGELEIRGANTFSYNHFLNEGIDQLITSVDEGKEKTINYVRLYRDGLTDNPIGEEGFKTTHILEALYFFYKSNGYNVSYTQSVDTINLTWNWIDDADFNNDAGLLFDLKGTSYYAFIRKDKVHLIIKEDKAKEIIKPLNIKINELKATEKNPEGLKHLKSISITEKINQRNILSIYTKPFQLKTKFIFEDSDKFNVTVKQLSPTTQKTGANYFLISSHNSFDVIDEWIAIPKKPSDSVLNVPDQFQYDSLALSIARARQDYDISKSRSVDFAYEKHNTAFERAKWDLQYQEIGAGLHLGLESVNILSSIGRGALGIERALNRKKRPDLIGIWGHSMAMFNKATGIINDVKDLSFLIPEKARRIEEDKEHAAREIAYNSFSIDLSHFRRKQDLLFQINSISNKYERTELNDFTLIEEYNKQNKIDDFNLRVYIPTQEQLKYLEAYREEFGVDCYIPNVELSLFAGMPPNIVRLLNIDDFGFTEVKNKLERDFLKARLKAGIKIVNIAGIKPKKRKKQDEIDLTIYVHQVEEARAETERIKKQTEEKIKIANEKLKELENSKNELNKKNDDLKKQLEACLNTPVVDTEKVKQLETQKTALETQLQKLQSDKTDLETKLREADKRLRETAAAAHNKELELKQAQEALEACSKVIEGLGEDEKEKKIKQLEKELKECNAEKEELKDEEKEKKIKQLEKEKEDLQIKLNVEGNRYSQIFDQLENAKTDLLNLTTEKEELAGQILTQSRNIQALTKKKEELEGQLLESQRSYADIKRQLDDCLLVHTGTTQTKEQEITNLKNKISDLTTKKEELDAQILTQSTQITELTKKKAELDKKVYDQLTQIKILTAQRDDAKSLLATCRQQLATRPEPGEKVELSKNVEDLKKCVLDSIQYLLTQIYYSLVGDTAWEDIPSGTFANVSASQISSQDTNDNSMWIGYGLANRTISDQFFSVFEKYLAKYFQWFLAGTKWPFKETAIEEKLDEAKELAKQKINHFRNPNRKKVLGAVYYYLKQGKDPYWWDTRGLFGNVIKTKDLIEVFMMCVDNPNFIYQWDPKDEWLMHPSNAGSNYWLKLSNWKYRLGFKRVFDQCFENFQPSTDTTREDLETIQNELNVCKADKRASDNQIIELNKAVEQNQRTIQTYRDYAEKANQSNTQLSNQVKLYIQEVNNLRQQLQEARDRECAIPDYSEYNQKYKNLEQDAWDQKFNLANFWRLKTNEAGKYLLTISALYYQWKTNYNNKGNEYKELLRKVIDVIHSRSHIIYSIAGQSWPFQWSKWTQQHFNQAITRTDELAQFIRTSLPRGQQVQTENQLAKNVRRALRDYDDYTKSLTSQQWKTDAVFQEIGKRSLALLAAFANATTKTINIWEQFRNLNIKREGNEPINLSG